MTAAPGSSPETSPVGRQGSRFTALLLLAMGLSTFTASVVGIIATFLIDEFGVTRRDIGTIVAVNVLAGALLSPTAGRLADRLGGTHSVVGVFALSAVAFTVAASAPVFALLFVAGILGGAAQAGTNPSTNKAIATHVPPGRRGVVTGLKQSGVQFAIFIGGVVVPVVSEAFGWRVALAGAATVAAIAVPVTLAVFPRDKPERTVGVRATADVPSSMWWLTSYGFLLGASGAAVVFVPLFAEEALGLSVRAGGLAIAVVGASSVVGRIAWARFAELRARYVTALWLIAVLSVAAAWLMLAAPGSGAGWMWVGVVVLGLGSSSWNAVGMLAVIDLAGPAVAGRASGRVLAGFLLGLAVAPAVYGQTIDSTGAYDAMWTISLILAAAAVVLSVVWRSRLRTA